MMDSQKLISAILTIEKSNRLTLKVITDNSIKYRLENLLFISQSRSQELQKTPAGNPLPYNFSLAY